MHLSQYFPWLELLLSDCGIKVSFAVFCIPVRCRVLVRADSVRASVPHLACKPLSILQAMHFTVILANSCSTVWMGKHKRAKMRAGGSQWQVGWTATCPQSNTYFQTKNFIPAVYINFPRVLNDGKVGIQINPTVWF